MAFCGNCGTKTDDAVKFCPSCGAPTGTVPAEQPSQAEQGTGYVPPVVPGAPSQDNIRDAGDNKTMSILSYILFFIPLLTGAHKTSPFLKYHVNQGTILFGVAAAYGIVSAILSSIIRVPVTVWGIETGVYTTPGWLSAVLWIVSLGICALCVCGIYNAATGKMKPLPLIGRFTIIK